MHLINQLVLHDHKWERFMFKFIISLPGQSIYSPDYALEEGSFMNRDNQIRICWGDASTDWSYYVVGGDCLC
jgi:hypothetical protein